MVSPLHHKGRLGIYQSLSITFSSLLLASILMSCDGGNKVDSGLVTAVAESITLEKTIEELGVVEATRVISITAPFSGRIVKILESGALVGANEVVAVLDTKQLEETLEERIEELRQIKNELEGNIENLWMALRSNSLDLASAQARLDLSRVQLEDVNINLSELEYLKSRELIPAEDVRTAQSRLNSTEVNTLDRDMGLRSQLTSSQSTELSQQISMERIGLRGDKARTRLDEAQGRLDSAEIKTPVDGMFIRHSRWNWSSRRNSVREVGENVDEGDLLGTIPDLSELIVRSQVPESEMLAVRAGTNVSLVIESLGNLKIDGVIDRIAPLAIERETSAGGQITASGQSLTGEKVFEVVIKMKERDARLKPGLTVRAKVVLERSENRLTIPINAVQMVDGNYMVQVLGKDTTEWRQVTIGEANAERVEILTGIKAGEAVVLDPTATPSVS